MATYDKTQLSKRVYLMPGTALGGEQVYITALCYAVNADLQKAWQEYLEETRHHQQVVRARGSARCWRRPSTTAIGSCRAGWPRKPLPPPEQKRNVETAIGAIRADQVRSEML